MTKFYQWYVNTEATGPSLPMGSGGLEAKAVSPKSLRHSQVELVKLVPGNKRRQKLGEGRSENVRDPRGSG